MVPRTDKLGNQLWSLQYDVIYQFPELKRYNLWREDRVFRNAGRALADLAYLREEQQ